ncbi:uncharacterized protein C8A04DRAFT_14977 [Dichotomopilus funicola]|uniref:Inosine/uridine-preferring nucleoside hydrolase domain-containing protein n=1 Tax=Dichotomopilus funicola TaxID=1934379 RepID=A0AAN6UWI2_9PEZI|nr:hypothetical protein C8A04DRAFT_14977 [Dichotomopilus funicola]
MSAPLRRAQQGNTESGNGTPPVQRRPRASAAGNNSNNNSTSASTTSTTTSNSARRTTATASTAASSSSIPSRPKPSSSAQAAPAPPNNGIPFRNTGNQKEYFQIYQNLQNLVKARSDADKPRIFVFTDVEQDYDDLLAIIFLAEMHRMGAIELVGFVANHQPAEKRVNFLRTVLQLLNLGHIPVGQGTPGVEDLSKHTFDFYYGLKNATFAGGPWNRNRAPPASTLIPQVLAANRGKEVTALMLSSLQDIGEFFYQQKKKADFHDGNFAKCVSQGGYEVSVETVPPATTSASRGGRATTANNRPKTVVKIAPTPKVTNNEFHMTQARNYHDCLATYRMPSDGYSKNLAMASRLSGTFMTSLFDIGPIGAHLEWLWMRLEFKFYWDPFNWPFLPHLNVDWYLNTRLGLAPNSPEAAEIRRAGGLPFHAAAPKIKVLAYDLCAAMGATGDDFMRSLGIMAPENQMPPYNRAAHRHRIFGAAPGDLGGIDPSRLSTVMEAFVLGGLLASQRHANQLIPRDSVQHTPVKSKIKLPIFHDKIAMRNHATRQAELAKAAAEADAAGKKQTARRLQQDADSEGAEARKLEEKIKKAEKVTKVTMPNRGEIPYEELYQEAMRGIRG